MLRLVPGNDGEIAERILPAGDAAMEKKGHILQF